MIAWVPTAGGSRGPRDRAAAGEGATMKPDQTLTWVQDGTERLRAQLAGLSDEALDGPTALPGWNRRYLFAHMAANADALRNLLHWARTGQERRMYASDQAREEGIAAGALATSAELRARFDSAAADLAADFDAMTDEAWDAKVITAQGLTRSANEILADPHPRDLVGRRGQALGGDDLGLGRQGHHRPGPDPVGQRDPVDAGPRGLHPRRRPGHRRHLRRPAARVRDRAARRGHGQPL